MRGFILIPVIWLVFFLALAAASFTLAVRASLQHSHAAVARAEAAALVDAGIALALHDLVNARASPGWEPRFPPDRKPYGCSLSGRRIIIETADEAGKVDLNGADGDLLRALLAGLGEPEDEAIRLADAILDFRDPDDRLRAGGSELEHYRRAGRSAGPKNAPFDSTLELAQVMGFDRDRLARVLPHVTAYSGLSGIDHTKASPELVGMLADRALQPRLGGSRNSDTEDRDAGATLPSLPRSFLAVSSQRVYSISAQATGDRNATFARQAVVRLGPARGQPYAMLAWRQVDAMAGRAATDRGAC